MTFPEALAWKAEGMGIATPRIPLAVCYALWIVQARNLAKTIDEPTFQARVSGCSRARLADPVFDKDMRSLVTYAINWRG